ncbi:MAG: formate dehydrogenase accessory sulfurtransferase FdhD [Acidobacteria bacterium]|nr:formate dehydrogenase accessory sulfurtransferase FdhD [Acidobacteriota bacterium]
MTDSPVRIAPVRRVELGTAPRADSDLVAVEEPLVLEIEHGPAHARARLNAGVILRTPGRDEDLVRGLLHAEGFLGGRAITSFAHPSAGHIRAHLSGDALDAHRAGRVLVRASACGLCGRDAIDDLAAIAGAPLPGGSPIDAAVLTGLPAALRARQAAFNETGGLHAAAFFDASGACLSSAEDVGRHNAVDKLVGAWRASPASPASPAVLLVSGRAAFEIAHKAVMARVPVLASVGAPSSLAVETARAFNLTLVGFLRDERFNIYSGFDRIV